MKNKTLLMTIAITFITMYSVAQVKGTYTDTRDGNVYKTVTIGNQVWMAENLRYLPSVVGPETTSKTTPYYYVYGYNGTDVNAAKAATSYTTTYEVVYNYTTYGVLYNWTAAMNGAVSSTTNPSGVQGVCPKGWHLPSDEEWSTLITYLGGDSIAGDKLKEIGTKHWTSRYSPNTEATNETSFTALPGGYHYFDGSQNTFGFIGVHGLWWSATEVDAYDALYYSIDNDKSAVIRHTLYKEMGFSIRCVMDK